MEYIYTLAVLAVIHLVVRWSDWISDRVDYINYTTQRLLDEGRFTDGCSIPVVSDLIHRLLSRSHVLCAGHDYAGRGWLTNVNGGWYGNLISWFAHMNERNPVYWIWGTVAMLFTLPYVVVKHNFGFNVRYDVFYIAIFIIVIFAAAIGYS